MSNLLSEVTWSMHDNHAMRGGSWHLHGRGIPFEGDDEEPIGYLNAVLVPHVQTIGRHAFFDHLDSISQDHMIVAECVLHSDLITSGNHFLVLNRIECNKEHRGTTFSAEMLEALVQAPFEWETIVAIATTEALANHWEWHGFIKTSTTMDDTLAAEGIHFLSATRDQIAASVVDDEDLEVRSE